MGNPYQAVFRDDNSDTRLAGAIDFTDQANQPGVQPVGIVLARSATLDLAAMADRNIAWDVAYDNTYDFNVITEVPAGLGMTLAIDGSSANITTTTAGVWWFELFPGGIPPDDTLVITYGLSHAGVGETVSLKGGSGGFPVAVPVYGEAVYLPSGATNAIILNTLVAATAANVVVAPQAGIIRLG